MDYSGEHSITFGDKNTWTDWHLIPSTRPVFNPPSLKSKYIDVPGADGLLDLSTLFTGRPIFGNRIGSLEFIVANDYLRWEDTYSEIANYLHGQSMHAILDDDPDFFYEGRFAINEWKSDRNFSLITIDYTLAPYKKDLIGSLEADDWEWDPFDFETGIIQESLVALVVNGDDSLSVEIIGSPQSVVPIFTASAILTVEFESVLYTLPIGVSRVPSIQIAPGVNTLLFSGIGTVTIDHRGGSL
jgi:hypothetical protein